MPGARRGEGKEVRQVSRRGYRPKPIPERFEEEPEPDPVPPGRGRLSDQQSDPTGAASTEEPEGPGRERVRFTSYSPLDTTKLINVKTPVDPSGAASSSDVIAMVGNVYLAVSTDGGSSWSYLDPTTMFPKFAGGLVGDQQMIYEPELDLFIWVMLHNPVPSTKDGAFRLAWASSADVESRPKSGWRFVDFVASDIDAAGEFLDQPHLSYSNRNLLVAVDADSGRIIVRIPLSDLGTGSIGWEYTPALSGISFQFSAPSGQRPAGAFLAGHVDTSTLRVVEWRDGDPDYHEHDVKVQKYSDSGDFTCVTPSGVDWSARCGARISGSTWQDERLWFSWTAPRSAPNENPDYPQPYTRVVRINTSNWKTDTEMQVWNPKYAFAYSALSLNSNGEVGISVAWGGPSDEADAAFGILGDFVVWYQDGSTATATGSDPAAGRWGDFLRTHQSTVTSAHFDGFGYFTNTDASGNLVQNPYHVRYGR
jgi:hypothetical protein